MNESPHAIIDNRGLRTTAVDWTRGFVFLLPSCVLDLHFDLPLVNLLGMKQKCPTDRWLLDLIEFFLPKAADDRGLAKHNDAVELRMVVEVSFMVGGIEKLIDLLDIQIRARNMIARDLVSKERNSFEKKGIYIDVDFDRRDFWSSKSRIAVLPRTHR